MGILLNRKSYPISEYAEAVLLTLGVFMFTYSEKQSKAANFQDSDSSYGVFLLFLYLACDSFTSQWQSKVFKSYSVDQFQMMLGVNIWSLAMTGFTMLSSGEFFSSIAFLLAEPEAMMHVVILSITSATGQLFIFYTIKEFGPVIFTIMMTTRQILSLFLSCLMFNHPLKPMGWISAAFVFVLVFQRIFTKGGN